MREEDVEGNLKQMKAGAGGKKAGLGRLGT